MMCLVGECVGYAGEIDGPGDCGRTKPLRGQSKVLGVNCDQNIWGSVGELSHGYKQALDDWPRKLHHDS